MEAIALAARLRSRAAAAEICTYLSYDNVRGLAEQEYLSYGSTA